MKAFRTVALLTLILFPILIVPATAQQKVNAEKLDQYFTQLADNNRFIGSVAVMIGDEVVFNEAYGMISAEGIPATPSMIF